MLRTASPDETQAQPRRMDISWPPTIKPPTLRAMPLPAADVVGRSQSARIPPGVVERLSVEERTSVKERTSWALLVGLIVYTALNGGDLLTTYLGLRVGMREGNPLMHALLLQHGFLSLILYKVVVVVAVIVGVRLLNRRYARLAGITLIICNVVVGLAVLLNTIQFIWR